MASPYILKMRTKIYSQLVAKNVRTVSPIPYTNYLKYYQI